MRRNASKCGYKLVYLNISLKNFNKIINSNALINSICTYFD